MGVSVPRRFAAVGKNDLTDRSLIEYGPFFPPFPYCAFRIVIEPDPLSRWWTAKRSPVGLISLDNPAIISIPVAFFCIWLFSVLDNSKRAQIDHGLFEAQKVRCETGIGAEGASGH